MTPTAAQQLAGLTHRERQVAEQVATGATNDEIAAASHHTVQTVKFHLTNAMRKLDCRSRTEVAALVWQARLDEIQSRAAA